MDRVWRREARFCLSIHWMSEFLDHHALRLAITTAINNWVFRWFFFAQPIKNFGLGMSEELPNHRCWEKPTASPTFLIGDRGGRHYDP